MLKHISCMLLGFSICSNLCAADLVDIYRQALDSDPIFKEAYHTYLANKELTPQALSYMLPQMNWVGQKGRNNIAVQTSIQVNQAFNNEQWQLTASQAIFNAQAWSQIKSAKASVKASQATLSDALQNLMLRTSQAYMEALLAKDTLAFAEAKKRSNQKQYDQANQRFKVGLETITAVYEAKSAYDQSVAECIAAKNNIIRKQEEIRKLTNVDYEALAPLKNGKVPLILPQPNNVQAWIDTGLRQNYQLHAARYNVDAARENITAQNAGHMPNVTLQGNVSDNRNIVNDTNFFTPSEQNVKTIALAVNVPLFQGGLVVSKTRQAKAQFQTANDKLEQAYRTVVSDTRVGFNSIIDGVSKVKADMATVESQRNSVESTQAQYEVGTRTMVDVVDAQQKLFDAQRTLAQDQYSYILTILNLKYLAGTLNAADLAQVNTWLDTTRKAKITQHQK